MRASATFLLLSFVQIIAAHEHHDDKIPEGEGISPDPIVSLPLQKLQPCLTDFPLGFNVMGPYSYTDIGLWSHFSHRNGPRSKLLKPI